MGLHEGEASGVVPGGEVGAEEEEEAFVGLELLKQLHAVVHSQLICVLLGHLQWNTCHTCKQHRWICTITQESANIRIQSQNLHHEMFASPRN